MGSLKILMSVAVTTLVLLQGCKLVSSRPSGSAEVTENYGVSKDYYALQNLLSNHLGGTSMEKSKVIDLLLQLLEEIDLPTLCEVIVNDTKANHKARLRVPIKYTKIDDDLLNSLDSQITLETQNNEVTFQTPSKMVVDADRTTSAESREQIVVTSNDEESRTRIDGAAENNHTPATYKYHTNELNNGDQISSQNGQYVKDDSLNNVNYPDTLSRSILSSGKENPSNDLPGKDLLHDGQVLYSSLLKDKTAPVNEDGSPVKSVGDLKQMYLRIQNKNIGEVDGVMPGYTGDINNKNILVKQIDVDRPRAQLFSQSLVLGDWMNKNKFDRNFLTTYTDNEDEMKAVDVPSYENNVITSNVWSDKVKSEFKTRFNPANQQKYARGYLGSQDIVGQMLIPESSTPPSTLFTYDPKDSLYSITPVENQRHVDYPEELGSNVIVQQPDRSLPAVAQDTNTYPRDGLASMAMFTQTKSNPAIVESENEVTDSDSNEAGKPQQIKLSADYSTTQEFINNNEMNEINNNKIAQEITNWIDASHVMPESRPTDKSGEFKYGEQGVSVDIKTQLPPHSYLNTTPISYLFVEPQVQPLLYETDNKTAYTSATELSQIPSEVATQATVVFSTTVDTEILTGNYEMTRTTASTAQEQTVTERAKQIRGLGVQKHTPASNLPLWAQRLNTDSSEAAPIQEDTAAVSGQTEPANRYDNILLNNEEVNGRNSTALFDSQTAQSKITYPENDLINVSTTTIYPQMEANMKEAKPSAISASFVDTINATESTMAGGNNATPDWMTNDSVMQTGVGQNEITQAGVTNSNITQAEVTNSDVTQTGLRNNEVTQTGVRNNEMTQTVVSNDGVGAGITKTDATRPGISNIEVTQASITNSDVTPATFTNNHLTKEVVTNSDVTRAEVTNSDITQARVSINEVTQAEVTNSDITQAGVSNTDVLQARMVNNNVTQIEDNINEVMQARVSNNDVTQAEVTNSDTTQAGVSNTDELQARMVNNNVTQIEDNINEVTQARVSNNEVTQAEVTKSDITQAGVSNTDVIQARIINNNVTQTEVNKNEVTKADVSNNEVTQAEVSNNVVTQAAGVSNNEVTQAGVSNNEVTQAEVNNNEIPQTEISNNEVTQARPTHSDITNIDTNNVTYAEVRQTNVPHNEVTNNQTTTTDFTAIVTQQSSELDTTTDQIQHTSEVPTSHAYYLSFTQTNNSTVLFSINATNDARFDDIITNNVTASTTDNNLLITTVESVIQEESAMQEKEIQDNILSIVNDIDIARNMSKDNKSDIGGVALNTKNQTSVVLSTHRNVLEEQTPHNNSHVSAETMESGIRGDVNNFSATADRDMDKHKALNMINEREINTTSKTEYSTSASPEVTSSFSNFQASAKSSPVSKIMERELQSYHPLTEINASLSINVLNDELSSRNVTPTSLESSTYAQPLNESLGGANTTIEVENATNTVDSAAFNSEWSASMQTDPTPLGSNTTVRKATENITVDSTVDNFHVAPKYVLEKTADFDHFIKPAVIDYGSNKVDGPTLDISIKQQSSETRSVEPTLNTNPITTQNATQVTGDKLTDHKDKGIYILADTEHNTTGSTSQATISFLAADTNDSETNNTNVDVIQSVTLGKPLNTGTLSQVLRANITTDNLKMISSKIAETKAKLSRINMDLLKPLRIRIPYEDSTEIPRNIETTGISYEDSTKIPRNIETTGISYEDSTEIPRNTETTGIPYKDSTEIPRNTETTGIPYKDSTEIPRNTETTGIPYKDNTEIPRNSETSGIPYKDSTEIPRNTETTGIPYEYSTEIPRNTETTGIREEKNTSAFKSEIMEQQTASAPESTNMVPQYIDNSTKVTYAETPAVSTIQYTTTEPTTSTLTATSTASTSETTSPASKAFISSVEVISSTITVPSSSIPQTSRPSSTDSNYKPDVSTDFTPNMLDGYSRTFDYSNIPNSDNLSSKDNKQISSTSLLKSGNEAKVYNFHNLPMNEKYQNKPSNLPYKSQFSDRTDQAKLQTKPVVDSWKAYNIAVGKSKTNANNQAIINNPGAPEIHLYSNYKYTPAPADNILRSYLWQARPWPKNAMYNTDQGDTHNTMLAAKPELYQNQIVDKSKFVNYQTKTLKKIDSLHDQVKKIGNTNIWGDRFSQGYYGRVFDDQSKPLNADDTTTWPDFHSRDMVNFDVLGDNLKYFNGNNQVHGVKNYYNSLNGNLGMKSSQSFDLNQRYRNLMKNFPRYHTSELDQGKRFNVEQKLDGSQPEYSGFWREDSSRAEGQTESSTQPETWMTSPARTDPTNQYKGVPAPEDYTCPGLFGYHKDPKNCQAFFICSWGMAHRVVCPPGTLYNSKEAVCDWAVNIRCTVTPDNDNSPDV